jgi:hypothetical protein
LLLLKVVLDYVFFFTLWFHGKDPGNLKFGREVSKTWRIIVLPSRV